MSQKLYQYYFNQPPTEITSFEVSGGVNVGGISTFNELKISGKLYDGSGTFGASGQILSSDGSKISWLNASTTNVGSATSVGINLDSTSFKRYLTFVENTSGNNIVRVNTDLTYYPNTNTLSVGIITATSFVRSGGTSSQFLKADGSVDSSTYLTSYTETDTLNSVTNRGSTTANNISVGNITASQFIRSGGTSSQFLKADGSVDSSTYLTSYTETDTLNSVTNRGSTTANNISVGNITASQFIRSGGTSSQFLKADGSVDSSTYLTSFSETDTLNSVTNRGNTTTNSISVGGFNLTGTGSVQQLTEKTNTSSTVLTGTINLDILTGTLFYFTSNASANWTFNIRGDSSTTLNNVLEIGRTLTITILTTQGATPYYANAFQIDGSAVTPRWIGGVTPSSGFASCINIYTYSIIKTANSTYTAIASLGRTT